MPHPLRSTKSLAIWLAVLMSVSSARGAGGNAADLSQRGKEVEGMTAIERDRLQRNWQMFQSLPEDRKQHYRTLHQQLEDDAKNGGKRLNHTMLTYSQWLQTLNPGQREDLRLAKTPAAKLDLVRKFKEEQDQQARSHVLDEPVADPGRWRRGVLQAKPLTPQELDAALQALVDLLPRSERDAIEQTDQRTEKWIRYRRIIQASARQAGGPQEWPDIKQQDAMLGAIKITEQAERLKSIKQDRPRRIRFVAVILSSFFAEMTAEAAPFQPKAGDLEKLYEQLDNTARDDLLRLPPPELNQELLRRFFREHRGNDPAFRDFSKSQQDFQGFVHQFLREAEIGRMGPPGLPGPDRRPPGREGPPDFPGDRGRPRPPRGDEPR